MLVKTIESVPAQPVEMDGAKDVTVRVIFGPADSAPTFAMRLFEMAPAGHTPFHSHPFEHQAIAMTGSMSLVNDQGETPFSPGQTVMISPDEKHQFRNASSDQPASMVCLVPIRFQK